MAQSSLNKFLLVGLPTPPGQTSLFYLPNRFACRCLKSQSLGYQTSGYPFIFVVMCALCVDRFTKVTLYSAEVNRRGTLRNESLIFTPVLSVSPSWQGTRWAKSLGQHWTWTRWTLGLNKRHWAIPDKNRSSPMEEDFQFCLGKKMKFHNKIGKLDGIPNQILIKWILKSWYSKLKSGDKIWKYIITFSLERLEFITIEGVGRRENPGIPCCETLQKSGIPTSSIAGGRFLSGIAHYDHWCNALITAPLSSHGITLSTKSCKFYSKTLAGILPTNKRINYSLL